MKISSGAQAAHGSLKKRKPEESPNMPALSSRTIAPARKLRALAWTLVALLVLGPLGVAQAASDPAVDALKESGKTFARIAREVSPAVVFIQTEQKQRADRRGLHPFYNDPFFERFFGTPRQRAPENGEGYRPSGQGSGFIYRSDGHILTNAHVVETADRVNVTLADGRELRATVVGKDSDSDVAVLKIDADNLPVVPLGSSGKLEIGEWVVAIGNPFGLSHTVTAGIVSAMGRSQVGIAEYEDFIQTDAAINPGNSGGPLLNLDGEVVGINSAIMSRSGGSVGIGFAIPMDMVHLIEEQLVADGRVTRGYLGVNIQNLDADLVQAFNLKDNKGVLVSTVQPDTPAERAGVENGDVIIAVNGQEVDDTGQLRNAISLIRPGEKAGIRVLRDGREKDLTATIGYRDGETPEEQLADKAGSGLGLAVKELDARMKSRIGGREGVQVESVEMGSPAYYAGLEPGNVILEVDRKPVSDPEAFYDRVDKAGDEERILVLVFNGSAARYLAIELNE